MLKKVIFFLIIFFLFSGRIVFSYWPSELSEPIELAYAFTERDNQEGDFDLAREAQFNAVLDYTLMLRSEEHIENYLDLCNQFGFKVFAPLPYYDNETKILDKDEIKRQVERWKSHSAIYSWYILDEPVLHEVPRALQKEFYDFVKSLDSRPISMAVNGSNSAGKWKTYFSEEAFDILFLVVYPYVKGTAQYAEFYMNLYISRFLPYKKGDYPVIPVIQAFYDSDESEILNPGGHLQEMYQIFENHELVSYGLAFYAWRPGGNLIGIREDISIYNEVKELISLNKVPFPTSSITIYPNPCNFGIGQKAKIIYFSVDSEVVVCIYDIAGNLVRTLNENDGFSMGGGFAAVVWDGNNVRGEKVARGVYIIVVTSSTDTVRIGKICLKDE